MNRKKSAWTPPTPEALAKLLKTGDAGVEKYHKMRDQHPEWTPDLTGQDLSEVSLLDADLSSAILVGVCLRKANCTDTCFCGADMRNANLEGAVLSRASLRGAVLNGANLQMVQGLCKKDWEAYVANLRASIKFAD